MEKIVIFGNAKMAELAYFYFTHDTPHEVVAFTVNEKYLAEKRFKELPVIPFETIERRYPPDKFKMFIGIGYKKLNKIRADKYFEAKNKGYKLISYLSSKATHWGDAEIGDNCFILENQVIQPTVRIGNDVVLWSGNHFGHNVVIGDHSWVSSHVVCSSGVSIGPYSFVGVNAAIRDNVKIGSECIIGMGAIINKDVKDKEVYIARPAEPYRLDSAAFERMRDI